MRQASASSSPRLPRGFVFASSAPARPSRPPRRRARCARGGPPGSRQLECAPGDHEAGAVRAVRRTPRSRGRAGPGRRARAASRARPPSRSRSDDDRGARRARAEAAAASPATRSTSSSLHPAWTAFADPEREAVDDHEGRVRDAPELPASGRAAPRRSSTPRGARRRCRAMRAASSPRPVPRRSATTTTGPLPVRGQANGQARLAAPRAPPTRNVSGIRSPAARTRPAV